MHEILLALLGHPGSIIREEPLRENGSHPRNRRTITTFRVADCISFLTPTERAAINRVVGLGSTYRRLRHFIRPPSLEWAESKGIKDSNDFKSKALGENGLYLRAFKVGVEELLDQYAGCVAEVERNVMKDPTLTLALIHASVREVSVT